MVFTFTLHSLYQAKKRLLLAPDALLLMLNSDYVVQLGREPRTNRVHKLFYSEIDDHCFVAVCDETTRDVVTVVPIEYHRVWRVSAQTLDDAKRIAQASHADKEKEANTLPRVNGIYNQSGGKIYGPRVKICVVFMKGSQERIAWIGTFPASDYGDKVQTIVQNPALHNMICIEAERRLLPGEQLLAVRFRFGKKGPVRELRVSSQHGRQILTQAD